MLEKIGNSVHIDERINPQLYDNSLSPSLNSPGVRPRIKFGS